MKINLFESVTSYRSKYISLNEALSSFLDGTYKKQVTELRELFLSDNARYNELKRRLPAITFCGQFKNGHKADDLLKYNKIMVIDVDKVFDEEFTRVRQCLCDDPYTIAVWTSPSGAGIKALLQLDYEKEYNVTEWGVIHKLAFQLIEAYFRETYEIIIDKSGCDICRLCFVSYDSELFIKKGLAYRITAEQLRQSKETHENPSSRGVAHIKLPSTICVMPTPSKFPQHNGNKNKPVHRDEISRIIRYLRKNSKSITTTYEDWYRVGYAIAHTFTYDIGLKYYMRLCELDGSGHNAVKSQNMLTYCYENMKNKITFTTILYLSELQGYIRGSSQGNNSCRCESE